MPPWDCDHGVLCNALHWGKSYLLLGLSYKGWKLLSIQWLISSAIVASGGAW